MPSGKDGTLYMSGAEVTPVTGWSYDREVALTEYGSNAIADGKTVDVGRKRQSGSFSMRSAPSFAEGAKVTAILYDGLLESHTGTMVVSKIAEVVDIDTGASTGWNVDFVVEGVMVKASASAP